MQRTTARAHIRALSKLIDLLSRRAALQGAQAALLWGALHLWSSDMAAPLRPIAAAALLLSSIAAGALWCLVAQAAIHACAHPGSFTGSRSLDNALGAMLCAENLQGFRDYVILHWFHHRYTNSDLDPNHVRAGEAWWHYIVTLYFRQIAFLERPEYKRELVRIERARGAKSRPDGGDRSGLLRLVREYPVLTRNLLLVGGALGMASLSFGAAGAALVAVGGLLPVVLGHVLIADFAYRSHHGLPPRRECKPYRGQDTHQLKSGVCFTLLNLLTWDFYNHRAHHVRPSWTLWAESRGRAA